MALNRQQKGLINSRIALRASRLNCQKKNFKWEQILFLSNSDRDFYSENNNVSQVYIYIPKIEKKNVKEKTLLSSMLPILC
jgi:hypothetical protein